MQRANPIALVYPLLAGLSQGGIDQRQGQRLYIQLFCQRGEIYLSTSNGRWQEEWKYGRRSATFNETVMSGGVCGKKKTNQSTVTLQSTASKTWGWCMMTQAAEHYLPNLGCVRLSWRRGFIVLLLVRHWAELGGIVGNRIHTPTPIPHPPHPGLKPITCLLYLSQQKTLRQRKIEPRLRFLISSSSCVRTVCGAHCCEKKERIKISWDAVTYMWTSLLLSFLRLLYFLSLTCNWRSSL